MNLFSWFGCGAKQAPSESPRGGAWTPVVNASSLDAVYERCLRLDEQALMDYVRRCAEEMNLAIVIAQSRGLSIELKVLTYKGYHGIPNRQEVRVASSPRVSAPHETNELASRDR